MRHFLDGTWLHYEKQPQRRLLMRSAIKDCVCVCVCVCMYVCVRAHVRVCLGLGQICYYKQHNCHSGAHTFGKRCVAKSGNHLYCVCVCVCVCVCLCLSVCVGEAECVCT